MLSSFFSTSKPIHHVIFIVLLGLALIMTAFFSTQPDSSRDILGLFSLLISAGIFQFIVVKNDITKANTFASLMFVFLVIGLLPFLDPGNITFALFFIILGMRRLMSLRSGIAIVQKIFDASFWFTCAAICVPGGIWYLILVFLAVLFYAPSDYRHWLVPFMGFGCAMVLLLVADLYLLDLSIVQLMRLHLEVLPWSFLEPVSFYIVPAMIVLLGLLYFSKYLINVINIQQRVLPKIALLAFYTLISFFLLIFNGSDMLINSSLLLAPVAALSFAHRVERMQKPFLKELMIVIPLLVGLVSFMLGWSEF